MLKIRHALTALLFLLVCTFVQAQDAIARQAPVDRRIAALDSITLRRAFPTFREGNLNAPSVDLYPFWNNDFVSNYGVPMPYEYKIDLRNFCMPCDSRLVTSKYGYRKAFRRNHYGTDIKLYVGDTVRAAFSGKVRVVANEGRRKGYGLYVVIRHDNGLETVYGHLSKQLVIPNQIVKAGQVIALGGNTGRSTGAHLHFETRLLGYCINPELMFDFAAQDALGDYYVYRADGGSGIVGNVNHTIDPLPMHAGNVAGTAFAAESSKNSKSQSPSVHKVKDKDTLSAIAVKYHTTVDALCRLNKIKSTSTLSIGQIIKLR